MPVKSSKKTKSISQELQKTEGIETKQSFTVPNIRKSKTVWIFVALCIIALLYYFRSLFLVAIINGQPISRVAFIQELEKQAGKQAFDSLVTKTLIYQEAQKQHVTVENTQVQQEISKIGDQLTKQGQKLDQVLSMRGMSKADLEDQIRLQKTIEKLVGSTITVSDKEIDDFIQKNKDTMPQDQKPETLRGNVKQQLAQQKMSEAFQAWIENLRQKAQKTYFVSY